MADIERLSDPQSLAYYHGYFPTATATATPVPSVHSRQAEIAKAINAPRM
jgi:hypothetical protein